MPDMTASIPHRLTRSEAKRRIQEHVTVVRGQYASVLMNLHEEWSGDEMAFSFTAVGQAVSGRVKVEDQVVNLTVRMPWLLQMIAETVRPKIMQQGRIVLD